MDDDAIVIGSGQGGDPRSHANFYTLMGRVEPVE